MNIVITAGGTTEHIDAVRGITNTGTGTLASIIASGLQEQIVFRMCSSVLAECPFPVFNKKRHHKKHQEHHRRFRCQKREDIIIQYDPVLGSKDPQRDRYCFIEHRQNGHCTQYPDLLSLKKTFRPGIQAIHKQGAQKKIDKQVVRDRTGFHAMGSEIDLFDRRLSAA